MKRKCIKNVVNLLLGSSIIINLASCIRLKCKPTLANEKHIEVTIHATSYTPKKKSFQLHARIIRTKKIWFTLTSWGFEIMRGLAEPGSICILNRADKSYKQQTYDEFEQEIGFPFEYTLLEALLLQEVPVIGNEYIVEEGKDTQIVSQKNNKLYLIMKRLLSTQQIEEIDLFPVATHSQLTFQYKSPQKKLGKMETSVYFYTNLKGDPFEGMFSIHQWQIQCVNEPLEMPFLIPKNYEKR